MSRRIVCDTGPLLHLSEAALLRVLEPAGRVHIPPAVEAELLRLILDWGRQKPEWIEVCPLESPFTEDSLGWLRADLLDLGEAEALALAAHEKSLKLRPRDLFLPGAEARWRGKAPGMKYTSDHLEPTTEISPL